MLSSVDAVAAEDTRETRKLLERFGIDTRLLSVREHNERHGAEQIDALLALMLVRRRYPIRGRVLLSTCAALAGV